TNNTATTSGGGIYNIFGTVTLHNNIIAGNSAGSNPECHNEAFAGSNMNGNSYNIFGTGGNAGGCPAGATDILPPGVIGTVITVLANNGGSTMTHALAV